VAVQTAGLLLEREAELGTLQTLLEGAPGGAGALAIIEGSAGIGKSRLLAETRAIANARGTRVLAARGGELETDFAFGVVRQLFEPLVATADPELRDSLLSGPAVLVEPLFGSEAAQRAREGVGDSFAIHHGLYWLAANLAFDQPTLIVVDDLHWADRPSLRWLDYLARRVDGLRLVVLVATRPAEQGHDPSLLAGFLNDPAAAVIRPGPLSVRSISALAEECLGVEPHERFCAAVSAATGGNPLFVTALLETVASERVLPTAEQAAHVLELGPRAISRTVSIRLARLPADAMHVARAAAILGDGSAFPQVAALAGLDLVSAGRAAEELIRVDLLRSSDPIEFFHPVVRTAVHNAIDAGSRIAMHRHAAQSLTAIGAPLEQAAGHLLLVAPAGDGAVVTTLSGAADRMQASGQHDAAVAYLRRALAEPPADDERFEIMLALGCAERRIRAPEALERLRHAVGEAQDPTQAARATLEYARMLLYANRPAEALDALRAAADQPADVDPDLRERLEAEIIFATRFWFADYYPMARERLAGIREEQLHGGVGTAQLLASIAVDEAARCGSRERTVALARRAVMMQVLQEEGAVGFFLALDALSQAGETEEAYRAYEEAVSDARRRGDLLTLSAALGFAGHLRLRHGDLLTAESELREGLELIRPTGTESALFPWYTGTLAEVLIERGELEEANELVAKCNFDEYRPDNMQLFFLRSARARLRLAAGEVDEALVELRMIHAMAEVGGGNNPNWLPAGSLVGLALHRLGKDADAKEVVRKELALSRGWGAPVGIAVALRTLGQIQGGATGLRNLADAVALLAKTPARLEYARGLIEYGAALRRANKRTDAGGQLRQGLELANRLGAVLLVEQASEELAALGARPRKLLQTGSETLTASERRVAQLAASDMTNKEIAQALFVTVKTVEVHLSSAYRKLEISSRRQLGKALTGQTSLRTAGRRT
jgi:DNA-binding CsgD family transcriptional regulator